MAAQQQFDDVPNPQQMEQQAAQAKLAKEQELQKLVEAEAMNTALGGDVPLIGGAALITRNVGVKVAEAAAPVLKEGVDELAEFASKTTIAEKIKATVNETRDFFVERRLAAEAAELAALTEARATMKPLREVVEEGVKKGLIDPKALTADYNGADLFVKNAKPLGDMLSRDELRTYAKLAVQDEEAYRGTLSGVQKFAREFKYDNANPELGFAIGPSRYGGTWNTELAIAAAKSDAQEVGIMALNSVRGAVQVIGLSAAGVKVAIGEEKEGAAIKQRGGDELLQDALQNKPYLKATVDAVLKEMEGNYAKTFSELPGGADDVAVKRAELMENAKKLIVRDIETGALERRLNAVEPAQAPIVEYQGSR